MALRLAWYTVGAGSLVVGAYDSPARVGEDVWGTIVTPRRQGTDETLLHDVVVVELAAPCRSREISR